LDSFLRQQYILVILWIPFLEKGRRRVVGILGRLLHGSILDCLEFLSRCELPIAAAAVPLLLPCYACTSPPLKLLLDLVQHLLLFDFIVILPMLDF